MWAIRRAANPTRSSYVLRAISQALFVSSTATCDRAVLFGSLELSQNISLSRNLALYISGVRNLSSRIDESGEPFVDHYSDTENLEETSSDSDVDSDSGSVKDPKMPLFKVVMRTTRKGSVGSVLDNWIVNGNTLDKKDVYDTLSVLKNRRSYVKALEFFEWVLERKILDFSASDYAYLVDLIAKVRGLQKAESYLERIPQSFRTEIVYESLLANSVILNNIKKAEEIFKKIKDLSLPHSIYAYNQLLILYKRMAPKKIPSLFKTMEREKVKPSLYSYKVLIDLKGRSKDIEGMEQVLKSMQSEGIVPDITTVALVTQYYIAADLGEKAEAILKEIEGDISKNRDTCKSLMSLYASIGKSDEVTRLWQFCQTKPCLEECLAAILAYGKLGNIEAAENVFETMKKRFETVPTKYYNAMLNLYANRNHLEKGKELIRRMDKERLQIGPLTLDALIKLYAKAGEVEKADQILERISKHKLTKPLYNSFATVLEEYAKKGDVHNAEKIFYEMRQMDFPGKAPPYHLLIQAYVKAKLPAYGFRERMKGDDAYMSKQILSQLNAVDAFTKKQAGTRASILDLLP